MTARYGDYPRLFCGAGAATSLRGRIGERIRDETVDGRCRLANDSVGGRSFGSCDRWVRLA